MAVSFKAVGTFTAGVGAITPPFPTGNNAPILNDIAILVVSSENEAISLTTANGFVEIGSQANKAAGTAAVNPASRLAVYWKRCAGSDAAPVVADSGDNTTAQIYLFSGCAVNGNPWDVYAEGNDSATNDLSGSIPGATTTVDNCLIFAICASSYNGTSTAQFTTWTNASLVSITEASDNTNTAGLGSGHGSAYGLKATAGAYNATTVTLAQTSYKGTMSIALKPELFPTVTLNSPADASSTTDTTPSIRFTGSDGNADTLEYQVQIHTTNDFGAFDIQSPVKQQTDSFDAGIYGIAFKPDGLKQYLPGATSIYQHVVRNAFDLLSTNHNRKATFSLASQGSTPVGIGFNSDGTKFYAICSSNYTMFQYTLANPYDFTSGVTYASKSLVLDTNCTNFWFKPDGSKLYVANRSTNIIKQYALSVAEDISTANLEKTSTALISGWLKGIVFNSDGTKLIVVDAMNHNLVQFSLMSAWDITSYSQTKIFSIASDIGDYCALWINPTGDILIARTDAITIKYELYNPTLKADSTSDAGFSDVTNSGDTHPFASGDQIDYTVQSALSAGTYYWRVRAKDTTGRNQWGDWSAVRSLTIQSGQSLVAVTGNFSFTGNAVNFAKALKLPASAGNITLTGSTAGLKKGLVLSTSAGNYAFAANAVNFRLSLALALATGSLTLTGNNSLLKKAIKTTMQSGSYNLMGYPANFVKALKVALQTGNFTLTGNQTALKKALIQVLQAGTFGLTGNNASLIKSLKTALEIGSLTLTGNNATFRKALILAASTGNFSLSGNDIALTKALKLAAEAGNFTLTGENTAFRKSIKLAIETGNFTVTGNQVIFKTQYATTSYTMQAMPGNFALTGNAVSLRKAIKIALQTGNYALSGNTITFKTQYATVSYVLHASTGSFSLTGNDVAFRKALKLAAEVGIFTIAGNSVNFQTGHGIVSYTMQADTGIFTLNGIEIGFKLALKLIAEPGSFELTGTEAGTKIVFLKAGKPVYAVAEIKTEITKLSVISVRVADISPVTNVLRNPSPISKIIAEHAPIKSELRYISNIL